ncbi:hypothetical protein CRG98_036500, partial [Punica granatum]
MEAYKNPNMPIEYRVRDLIGRMSLKEKIGQMAMTGKSSLTPTALRDGSVGGINAERGPYDSAPVKDWADKADEWQQAALQSRLGIPLILGVDAIHGHNNAYGTTIFPHNVGLGATRDAELIQRIGAATALEARAGGINYTFAPSVAVVKDVRWNRCYESYSEDPEIVGRMTSIITGLQGIPPAEHSKGHPFVAGRGIEKIEVGADYRVLAALGINAGIDM